MSKISYGFSFRFIRIPLLTFVPSRFYASQVRKAGRAAFMKNNSLKGAIELRKRGEGIMSAFLVDKGTIDRILPLVASECRRSEFFAGELIKKLNLDITDSDWKDKLGQKMWDLNQLALGYRYGNEREDLRYFFEDVSGSTGEYQMFKSLKCWLYQCSEGEIQEKSVLYRAFSHEISLYLALRIIQSMPEYRVGMSS